MYLLLRERHLPKIKSFHYSVVSIILFLILLSVNQLADADTPEDQRREHGWLFYGAVTVPYENGNWNEFAWKPSAKSVELTRLNGANAEVVGSEERITWGSTYRATVTAPGVDIRYQWWTFDLDYKPQKIGDGRGRITTLFNAKKKRQDDLYLNYSDFTVTDEDYQCLGVIAFNIDNGHVLGSFTNCNVVKPNKPGRVSYYGKKRGLNYLRGQTIEAWLSDGNGVKRKSISYQWQWTNGKTKGWKNFAGQTNKTFKLKRKWAGKKHMRVMVTYKDKDGYMNTAYGPKINKNYYK